ncbi:MAG: hypothetical protein MZV64_38650 [Ignavibacteriales bacterium]|nr:hypothetical protein [Ignavibacteriales bacterium]
MIAYAYIQDRFELEDLVLNLGLRMDFFDIKAYSFKNRLTAIRRWFESERMGQ